MTREEFRKRIDAIKKEADERAMELCRAYAYAHNDVQIGDMISDHKSTIRVERIGMCVGFGGIPEMRYCGPEYTKSGAPRKDGRFDWIYQSNIKK